MRFRERQYHGCARCFCSRHNRLEKIEAHQIESADRVAVAVGVTQHIAHIYQWHGSHPPLTRESSQVRRPRAWRAVT